MASSLLWPSLSDRFQDSVVDYCGADGKSSELPRTPSRTEWLLAYVIGAESGPKEFCIGHSAGSCPPMISCLYVRMTMVSLP